MQRIIYFLIRNKNFILFLTLLSISISLNFSYNEYNKSKFINSSNFIFSSLYDTKFTISKYLNLEKEKKQLNTEVRKLNEKALAHAIEEIESTVNVSHNAQSKKHSKSKKLDEAVSSPFGDGGGGQKFGGGMGSPGFGRLIRLNAPRLMPQTDYSGQVVIQLTVNDKGVVISAKSTSATTHPDQNVIKLVVDHVKKNVKFKAQPGAYIRTAYYTVQIEAG